MISAESTFSLPDRRGRVNHLPLQVARVHRIEVHQPQRSHACRRQIQRQRRAQPARTHAQHLRSLQLLLPLHAHLGQDQVARVPRNLFVRKLRKCHFSQIAVAISYILRPRLRPARSKFRY